MLKENSKWFDPLWKKINKLMELEDDWDSYGAKPIKLTNARAAMHVLWLVMNDSIPLPEIVPTPEGGLHIEWCECALLIEIEVKDDCLIELYYRDDKKSIELIQEISFDLRPLITVAEILHCRLYGHEENYGGISPFNCQYGGSENS